MIFERQNLDGLVLIGAQSHTDQRGAFARVFCEEEFATHGLVVRIVQSSISFNPRAGTVRGLHFQAAPHDETKLVRCTSGAIFDVAVDLRRESATYLRWQGFELSADNRRSLYIPAGFAHGFQAIRDDTEVLYMIDKPYVVGAARGVRWNDPAIGVTWPLPVAVIAERDLAFADWAV